MPLRLETDIRTMLAGTVKFCTRKLLLIPEFININYFPKKVDLLEKLKFILDQLKILEIFTVDRGMLMLF